MKIKEIMTKKVITCQAKTPVKEIAKNLIEHKLTGMPVVEGDKVIGIVTEADLIMQKARIHIPSYIQLLDSYLYLEDPKEVGVELQKILAMDAKQLMTSEPTIIGPDDTVQDLATLIEREHVNPIPVVEDDKLVGIVSRADVVKLLTRDDVE